MVANQNKKRLQRLILNYWHVIHDFSCTNSCPVIESIGRTDQGSMISTVDTCPDVGTPDIFALSGEHKLLWNSP